jgi:hypothetical protein
MKSSNAYRILFLAALIGLVTAAGAQDDKAKRLSPPAQETETVGDLKVGVYYSSPSVRGRTLWGGLVPYGQIWRTGANEATVFEVNEDVLVNGKALPAGKYALFTIPNADRWTFIFNKKSDQWGAYGYSDKEDALRVEGKPGTAREFQEELNFEITPRGDRSAWVNLAWGELVVGFGVERQK